MNGLISLPGALDPAALDMVARAIIDEKDAIRHGRAFGRFGMGPNLVSTKIIRRDGSVEDLGISENLLTNAGRDLMAKGLGHATGTGGTATGTSATSLTNTGATFGTDVFKGWRVYCPVAAIGTKPVYGNISSHTGTVITVDQWWTDADITGTTPSATNGYLVLASNVFRFLGLTSDAGAASAADTVLASEITTNGGSRALATFAHSDATATFTLVKAFSFSGTLTAIHKMGLLTGLTSGVLGFETVLNADATVVNGDSMTVTWTGTISG